jgi:hypothetical protein
MKTFNSKGQRRHENENYFEGRLCVCAPQRYPDTILQNHDNSDGQKI